MTYCISRALAATIGGVTTILASSAVLGCGGSAGSTPNADASETLDEGSLVDDAPGSDGTSNGDTGSGGDAASGGDSTLGLDSASSGTDAASDGDAASKADASSPVDAKAPNDGAGPADAALDADAQSDAAPALDAESPTDAADADVSCLSLSTPRTLGGTALSSGFTGTALAYDSLSGVACVTGNDCVPSCVAAGGTMTSCATGSACVLGEALDSGLGCFPPSYWLSPNLALSELNMTGSAASLTMVATSYFDALVVTNFALSVPDGATIRGIQFDVRRATMFGAGEDMSIQVLQNGVSVGTNHRVVGTPWPTTLTYVTYGGPSDTWGVSWTPADIRAAGFGIAITPQYTQMAGNDPAYVDSVRVTVYYAQCN